MRTLLPFLFLASLACGPKKAPAPAATPLPAGPEPTAAPVTAEPPPPVVDKLQEDLRSANEAVGLLTRASAEFAQQAITTLARLQIEYPKNAAIAYDLGFAFESLGDLGRAEAQYRQATLLDPSFAAPWIRLGALAGRRGQLADALQYYRLGIERNPKDVDLRVAEVATLIRLRRFDESIASSRRALQVNANSLNIYANLGIAYIEQNNLGLAKFILLKALNTVDGAESNPHIHAYLGRIHYLEKHVYDARRELELALRYDPNLVPALVYMSDIHLDNRAYDQMVPLLEKARVLESDNIAVHMNLGIAYRGVQRFDEAMKEYETVLRLDARRAEPYLNQAILLADHQKKYRDAVSTLERYKAAGGTQVEKVDAWIADMKKEQERADRQEKRRKDAEERERKREEERRFMEEFQKKQQEEEQRRLEEEKRLREQGPPQDAPPLEVPTPVEAPPPPPPEMAPPPTPPADPESSPWGAPTGGT
jgi:tetratricopeptide (TPR) repeat protein